MGPIIPRPLRLNVFDDELLSRSRSGTVWGRIYFELSGDYFPDPGWSDMTVVFSDAWLRALVQIASTRSKTEQVHFMDGPFSVIIHSDRSGSAQVDLLHETSVKHSARVLLEQALKDAISVCERLISICQAHNWTDDTDYLRLLGIVSFSTKFLANCGRVTGVHPMAETQ